MADQATDTATASTPAPTALEGAAGAPAAAAADTKAEGSKPADQAAPAAEQAKDCADTKAGEKTLLEAAEDGAEKKADDPAKDGEPKAEEQAKEPAYAKELKRPDSVPWNDGAWQAVAPVLAQHKISQEAAQGLIDSFAAYQSAQQAELTKQIMEAKKASRAECQQQFQPADFSAARRALDMRCPDEALKTFFLRELGDHPAFIRMMADFGRAISDDPTPGAASSGGGPAPANRADKFYGSR
jgi:hypothetical protein